MNNEDISDKKLTLQGLSKLKLDLNLNSSASPSTGATVVKKRRKNLMMQKNIIYLTRVNYVL